MPCKHYTGPRMIRSLTAIKREVRDPIVTWGAITVTVSFLFRLAHLINMVTRDSTLKNKITALNDKPVHFKLIHLMQLLFIYLSLEVVRPPKSGRGWFSHPQGSQPTPRANTVLAQIGCVCDFPTVSSAVPDSSRPSSSNSDTGLPVARSLINTIKRQPGC